MSSQQPTSDVQQPQPNQQQQPMDVTFDSQLQQQQLQQLQQESDTNDIYHYDEKQQSEIRVAKPWDRDANYFSHIKISSHALLKMLRHAKKGGNLEIMGMLIGKLDTSTMIVMDSFALPVEGTETRVNAHAQAYEYMAEYCELSKMVGRREHVIGWYHSHPGYGCWLSGIDVGTQTLNQQFQDPFVAIVIDPIRTISTGKVDIGAFRTYPANFKPTDDLTFKYQSIPMNKIEDFGVHCRKYYSLEISYFKSELDTYLLECLSNKYWYNTLGTSSLTTNSDYTARQLTDLCERLEQTETKLAKGTLRYNSLHDPAVSEAKSTTITSSRHSNHHHHHHHHHHQQKQQSVDSQIQSQQQDDSLSKVTGDCAKVAIEPITGLMALIVKDTIFNFNRSKHQLS